MSKQTEQAIRDMLDSAEEQGRCLYCNDHATLAALRRRCQAGQIVEPHPRCFADSATWNALDTQAQHLFLARAIVRQRPDLVFNRQTAAVIWGLSVTRSSLASIHASAQGTHHGSQGLLALHHDAGHLEQTTHIGLPVTTLSRTVFDCACHLPFGEGLAVADAALRVGATTKDEMRSYAAGRSGARNIRRARLVIEHANGLAANGGESVARATMLELGFEEPTLQLMIVDPMTKERRYVDFAWCRDDGTYVFGELDGKEKYLNPTMTGGRRAVDVLADERRRESRLTLAGAPICRFSYQEVLDRHYFERLLSQFDVPRGQPIKV